MVFLKWLTGFLLGTVCAGEQTQYQQQVRTWGSGGKIPCVLCSQLLDSPILVTQR